MSKSQRSDRGSKGQALRIVDALKLEYPEPACALVHANPYQLLVATILSAQCTDERVNMVTPSLFAKYPDVESLAVATQADVEEIIRSTGFFGPRPPASAAWRRAWSSVSAARSPARWMTS